MRRRCKGDGDKPITMRGRIGFLLLRYVEDPWNAGNPDALDEVRADDLELGSGMDPDGLKEFIHAVPR